jgi:hypothetical protein
MSPDVEIKTYIWRSQYVGYFLPKSQKHHMLENFQRVIFNRVYSQFSNIRCGRFLFLMDFLAGNSKQLQKLVLEGKIG